MDTRLTRYWRPFGTRPLAEGTISPARARLVIVLLALGAVALILTLPWPHDLYILAIMGWSYLAEYAYQIGKRRQRYPLAQILGRTDFALFPVAGYLVLGLPDITALLYFVFFYPFALAHLGANDMADITNDRARGPQDDPRALRHDRGSTLGPRLRAPPCCCGRPLCRRARPDRPRRARRGARLRHGRDRRARPPPGGVGGPSPAPALSPGHGALRGGS